MRVCLRACVIFCTHERRTELSIVIAPVIPVEKEWKSSRGEKFGLASMFNGVSTFVGYLKSKPSL